MNREFYGHRIGMNLDDDSFLNVLCGYVAILFCESEAWNFVGICYFSHCLFMIEFPPRCPQVVWCHRGEIELFSTALAQGRLIGRMWSAKEKSLQMLCHNRELNPDQGENRRWDTFIPPLSYHDPDHREDRQGDHSFSHWDIMTRATERTDSEIHSFSHWAVIIDFRH